MMTRPDNLKFKLTEAAAAAAARAAPVASGAGAGYRDLSRVTVVAGWVRPGPGTALAEQHHVLSRDGVTVRARANRPGPPGRRRVRVTSHRAVTADRSEAVAAAGERLSRAASLNVGLGARATEGPGPGRGGHCPAVMVSDDPRHPSSASNRDAGSRLRLDAPAKGPPAALALRESAARGGHPAPQPLGREERRARRGWDRRGI